MDVDFFFTTPVQSVLVTEQNLQEVAEWCGGKVASTESRRKPGKMDSYVWVPTPKGTTVSWAFAGMYVTKRLVVSNDGVLHATWGVFRKDYIMRNYFEDPIAAMEATWQREKRELQGKDVRDAIQAKVRQMSFQGGRSAPKEEVWLSEPEEEQETPEIPETPEALEEVEEIEAPEPAEAQA